MKYQTYMSGVILVLSLAVAAFAQPIPAVQNEQKPGVVAWTVEVGKTNGFSGGERSRITVNSAGELFCKNGELNRGKSLSAESQRQLAHLVDAVRLLKTKTQSATAEAELCTDCESVGVTLTHRKTDGKNKVYASGWNVLTRKYVPEEVVNLYNAVTALSCAGD